MSLYSFGEIFPEITESFPDFGVRKVIVDASKRSMSIIIVPSSIESIDNLERAGSTKKTYQLSSLEVSLNYQNHL